MITSYSDTLQLITGAHFLSFQLFAIMPLINVLYLKRIYLSKYVQLTLKRLVARMAFPCKWASIMEEKLYDLSNRGVEKIA